MGLVLVPITDGHSPSPTLLPSTTLLPGGPLVLTATAAGALSLTAFPLPYFALFCSDSLSCSDLLACKDGLDELVLTPITPS